MSVSFKTNGPLREEESCLYVERREDEQIRADITRGRYVTLLGARQTGKTSLLLRLRQWLLEEGHLPIYVDLCSVPRQTAESCYRHLIGILQDALSSETQAQPVDPAGDQFAFRRLLRNISREAPLTRRVVILLDEVSALPQRVAESFFSTLRAIHNEREASSELGRCSFVMTGSFPPDDLFRNSAFSPFAVASRVYTSDVDQESVTKLIHHLVDLGHALSDDVPRTIYHWTNGHVYLTQRVCSLLEKRGERCITAQLVEDVVETMLGKGDMTYIYNELKKSPEGAQVVRRILIGAEPLRFSRASRVIAELELVGVVTADDQGYCAVRNEILRKALKHWLLDARSKARSANLQDSLDGCVPTRRLWGASCLGSES